MKNNKSNDVEKINRSNLHEIAKHQTPETIGKFINDVMSMEDLDYNTVVDSVAIAALAGAYAADNHKNGGITGFQASYVMWKFIQNYMFPYNQTGLKLIDFDDMLYPQYDGKFSKTITKDVWQKLQQAAEENLKRPDISSLHSNVVNHWKSIVNGKVPFGYTVKDK